jgi:hypothetical protein
MALSEIIRVQMNEDYYCEIKKYRGSYGEYYSVNNVNYDIHFPIEWVFQLPEHEHINDIPFGPETCYHCLLNGYYNGVFIGYCVNCAFICSYKRGNGLEYGIEREHERLDTKNSIWNLYLQNLSSLIEVGDRQLLLDYDYKTYYTKTWRNRNRNQTNDADDITVTYNNSFVYSTTNDEDDDTITSFEYDYEYEFYDCDDQENI